MFCDILSESGLPVFSILIIRGERIRKKEKVDTNDTNRQLNF